MGEIGGGEKVFLALLEQLPVWNIEPILACMRPGPLAALVQQQGIKTYEFKEHRYRQFFLIWEGIQWLKQIIQATGAKLIHANHASHAYTSLAAQFTGIPEVWHIHDYPYHWDWVERALTQLPTDHVIFTTHKVKSGYPSFHQHPHSVIPPCCIDPKALRALVLQPAIRAKYQLPAGPLLLTVARLQSHKGHRYLIDAVPKILERYPNVTFAIVGKPVDAEQAAYQQSLIEQTHELGVQNQVKFLGYVSDEDLTSLYHEATALVHPAISEGFGLVLLEAMMLGVPVIAAAADGPKELIQHKKTGLLVPTHNSEELAAAIINLLERPELAATFCTNAIAASKAFSIDRMVEATIEVYRSLVHLP